MQAQSHHEIGLTAGFANYYGDLQDKVLTDVGARPLGGISYKYFMNPHVGLRFGVTYTALRAADSLSESSVKQNRNLNFQTNLFEAHAGLELNLLPIEANNVHITPYVFGGIAVFHYNPYTYTGPNNDKVFLRPLSTEGQDIPVYPDRKQYNLVNVAFPIGGGLKFFVGKTLMISTELGFRYTNTDYLDDVSKSYVNMDTLAAYRGPQAVDLSFRGDEVKGWDGNYPDYKYQRGDSQSNDWYWFGNITVAVYLKAFGNFKDYWQANCPAFFRR